MTKTQTSGSLRETTHTEASVDPDLSGGSIPAYEERFKGVIRDKRSGNGGRWRRTVDEFVRACTDCGGRVYPGKLRVDVHRYKQPKQCPSCREVRGRGWVSPSPPNDPKHLQDAMRKPSKHAHLFRENWVDEHSGVSRAAGALPLDMLTPVDEWDQEIAQ